MKSKIKNKKQIIAILMSIRDEESIIDLNISYHLDLGVDYIFIVDHCSIDNTSKILETYKDNPRVIVVKENDPVFDHAKIVNKLLKYANDNYKIDWFIFLDADEFFSVKDKNIHNFIDRLEENEIPYATIGWINSLFDYIFSDYTCSPVHPIDTSKYFIPWPEKKWQEYGHFRKAIVKNHKNIEVVVGGHYVRTENNLNFFGNYHWNPFIVPLEEAKLLHFEFRDGPEKVYNKWEKLAAFENDSSSPTDAPYLERIYMIREYVKKFKNNLDEITKMWFSEHRTFWGTIVPEARVVYDSTISIWYRKYFRKKVEGGGVKSVCLVRSGHLGDVIMTEPVAKFLSKYVNNIYLATNVKQIKSILDVYDRICKYNQTELRAINSDLAIKLVYELSDNKKTYVQGYMESIGFYDYKVNPLPILKNNSKDIIKEKYFLIAPDTSEWEKRKRCWGYDKYIELSELLSNEYNIKCIFLKSKHTFDEMMSLINYCDIFVGNDSGPAIIAQSLKKKSFVIFGATCPSYTIMSNYVIPIYDVNRHKICQHTSRQEEINCCEEFCMDKLTVKQVFEKIKLNI